MKINKCINPKNYNFVVDNDGKKRINFYDDYNENNENKITLRCGKCLYCQKKYSNEWVARLVAESTIHSQFCFLTLTYNDKNLPKGANLKKDDLTKFIKRLRHLTTNKIRYYACGEYGARGARPHYHLIVFGYCPDDLVYFRQDGNTHLFLSKKVHDCWGLGFVSVGVEFNVKTLKYMTKYLSKVNNNDLYKKVPTYSTMSRMPGLGLCGVADYEKIGRKIIIKSFDYSIYDVDKLYVDGKSYSIPRYYDKIAEASGFNLDQVKKLRDEKAKLYDELIPSKSEKYDYWNMINENGYSINHLFTISKKKKEIMQLRYLDDYEKQLWKGINWQLYNWLNYEN